MSFTRRKSSPHFFSLNSLQYMFPTEILQLTWRFPPEIRKIHMFSVISLHVFAIFPHAHPVPIRFPPPLTAAALCIRGSSWPPTRPHRRSTRRPARRSPPRWRASGAWHHYSATSWAKAENSDGRNPAPVESVCFDYIPFFLSQILPLLVKSHDTVVPSSESRSVGAKNFNITMVYGRYIELVVYKPIYNVWGPTL